MTLPIAIATQEMLAAEAKTEREAEAAALLAEVLPALPATVHLSEIDHGDQLADDQLEHILRGGNPWDLSRLDQYESDTRWQGIRYELDSIQNDLDLDDHQRDVFCDIEDDVREKLEERDTSDLLGALMQHTPSRWLRYRLGDLDQDEQLESILGLIDHLNPNVALRLQTEGILANAAGYCEGVYLLIHTDEYAAIMDAAVGVQQRGEAVKLTAKNPWLCVYSSGIGNGWADEIGATVTVDFNPDQLHVDTRAAKSPGYSWTDEVAGVCAVADMELTFAKEYIVA